MPCGEPVGSSPHTTVTRTGVARGFHASTTIDAAMVAPDMVRSLRSTSAGPGGVRNRTTPDGSVPKVSGALVIESTWVHVPWARVRTHTVTRYVPAGGSTRPVQLRERVASAGTASSSVGPSYHAAVPLRCRVGRCEAPQAADVGDDRSVVVQARGHGQCAARTGVRREVVDAHRRGCRVRPERATGPQAGGRDQRDEDQREDSACSPPRQPELREGMCQSFPGWRWRDLVQGMTRIIDSTPQRRPPDRSAPDASRRSIPSMRVVPPVMGLNRDRNLRGERAAVARPAGLDDVVHAGRRAARDRDLRPELPVAVGVGAADVHRARLERQDHGQRAARSPCPSPRAGHRP